MTKRLAPRLLACFALLGGCAPQIAVRHPLAPARLRAEDVPKLARIALVMEPDSAGAAKASASVNTSALGQLLGAALTKDDNASAETHLTPSGLEQTLVVAAGQLGSPFSRIAAFAVAGPSTNAFLESVGPTSVLTLTPSVVRTTQEQQVQESKDRQGNIIRTVSYQLVARWQVGWRLASWPEGTMLASGAEAGGAGEVSGEPLALAEWLEGHVADLGGWADGLRPQILPRTAMYWRRMWKEKDVRADGSGCYAAWNAGALAESEGRWEDAKGHYRRALAAARRPADRNLVSAYLASLDRISESRPAAAAAEEAWFAEPIAIAPFANETTNVRSSDSVRDQVREELLRMGYRVPPFTETDPKFRSVGVSQGGHLHAVSAKRIAAALGMNRWITGTINEFKVINVGVYYRRQARVTLGLTDASGRTVWEQAGVSVRQVLAKPRDAGKMFVAGLVGSLVEKATGTFLKEDALAAVRETVPYLPARNAWIARAGAAPAPRSTMIQAAPPPATGAGTRPAPVQPAPVVARPVTPAPVPMAPAPVTPAPKAASPVPVSPPATPVTPPPAAVTPAPAVAPVTPPPAPPVAKPEVKPAPEPKPEPMPEVKPEPKPHTPEKPATPETKSPVPETKEVPGNPPAENPGQAKKAEAVETPKKADATDKPAKADAVDTAKKADAVDKPVKDEGTGNADKPAKGETTGVTDKPEKPEKVGEGEEAPKVTKPKKPVKTRKAKKPKLEDTEADHDKGGGNEKKNE